MNGREWSDLTWKERIALTAVVLVIALVLSISRIG